MQEQPELRAVPKDNLYEVASDYTIKVEVDDEEKETSKKVTIVVPADFQFDGASVPSPGWQLIYSPFHPDVILPSLIHDWLYANHQVEREQADEIFHDLLILNGVPNIKAKAMWGAVHHFAGVYWGYSKEDKKRLKKLGQSIKKRPNYKKYKFPKEFL